MSSFFLKENSRSCVEIREGMRRMKGLGRTGKFQIVVIYVFKKREGCWAVSSLEDLHV